MATIITLDTISATIASEEQAALARVTAQITGWQKLLDASVPGTLEHAALKRRVNQLKGDAEKTHAWRLSTLDELASKAEAKCGRDARIAELQAEREAEKAAKAAKAQAQAAKASVKAEPAKAAPKASAKAPDPVAALAAQMAEITKQLAALQGGGKAQAWGRSGK